MNATKGNGPRMIISGAQDVMVKESFNVAMTARERHFDLSVRYLGDVSQSSVRPDMSESASPMSLFWLVKEK